MTQTELDTGVDPTTDDDPSTVYVITVRWDGNPHPDVLGVFSDEESADRLMRKCRNWPREWPGLGPIAWEKKERKVQRGFNPEEYNES